MDALRLLSGDAQTFLDKVWASRVHLHQTDPAVLVGLLTLDDVDRLLTASGLRTPALRVVKDGSVCPASGFTRSATIAGAPLTGLVDARKALAMYDDGATLVLQGLHRYWPPLTELVRRLEVELGHPCQANAYLTPPGSQGFARHRDTHDVFVFQTHGHKQWQVVEDATGPEPGPRSSPGSSPGSGGDAGTERDIVLEPGLSMYLPTGTPHSARSQDQASLHVTVGINRLTWRDLLERETERILAAPEYDAPLPAGYLTETDRLAGPLAELLAPHSARVSELDADKAAERAGDRFLTDRSPALGGGLRDRTMLAGLEDGTVLVRRPTTACLLRREGDRLRVLLGDRELRMPLHVTAAMEHVRDHERLAVEELAPWLDAESRLVLCRRLVREGLLRIAR
ncbi:MAG TPA: cupin domain-containing protein [Marmoricola sp.]|nr:cupin domain-containing protein [Marmoricola sp.]